MAEVNNDKDKLKERLVKDVADYRENLISYFSLLIEIDHRLKKQKYERINNGNTDSSGKAE